MGIAIAVIVIVLLVFVLFVLFLQGADDTRRNEERENDRTDAEEEEL